MAARVKALLAATAGRMGDGPLGGISKLSELKAQLEKSSDTAFSSLAQETTWNLIVDTLQKCGYEDEDLHILVADLGQLGQAEFASKVPQGVVPRAAAALQRFIAVFAELGMVTPPSAPQQAQGSSGGGTYDAMFLGRVVAAVARQDPKAVEELTAQAHIQCCEERNQKIEHKSEG